VTREEYNEWRHHPVSKVFLQFLRDKKEFLTKAMMDQWLDGNEAFDRAGQTVRGQIIELGEIADMPFEQISEFYKQEEKDGAKDTGRVDS
jgi:hypothetical protein